ncbi:TonB-dependent receptor [Chitinophaga sp.]|uniref:SusC/RagA family TonB-linked outer membrane protein n=1 Tax=Chitinophaga sp. TaxID=1869181 RepID=UPI0031DF269D
MKKIYNWSWLPLLLLLVGWQTDVQAQVNGKVTDAISGAPIPGVSIQVKGTSRGTQTDANGLFTIAETNASSVLVFTFMGKQRQEVSVGNRSTINISLSDDNHELQEAVVIGYGTQKKKELTGSITTVTAKDFQQGNIQTPEQLIAGKVAGVSISSNSGQPGVGSTIRIRGGSSLNASNDPLIVVDGVPLSGSSLNGAPSPMSLINPSDIESFTVLKDASATAIYGSRASNGVILITTKKGTSGRARFQFTSQVSAATLAKKIAVMSADEVRAHVKANGTPTQISLLGDANTNWQDEIYQTAIGNDNNLSVSGAFHNIPYRLSAGYLHQNGVLITDKLQRGSAGINISPQLFNKHLKIDVNVKGALTQAHYANAGAIINAVQFDPTQPVYDPESPFGGYFEWYSRDGQTGQVSPNSIAPRNPVALIRMQDNDNTVKRSFGNLQLDYKFHFLPDLRANLNLGYDLSRGHGNINVPENAAQNYGEQYRGVQNKFRQEVDNRVMEFYLAYNKELPQIKSTVNVTGGYGYYDNATTNFNFATLAANGDTVDGTKPVFPFDIPRNTLISYYGRLIYSFNEKYTVAASIRTDGSSRFSPENRWGVFPSAAFTWRINREAFMQSAREIEDLKLRVSYGVTGNQDGIANYSYMPVYSISSAKSQYQIGDRFYYMASPAAYDSEIKWEETATYNVGLDYALKTWRLRGSVDAYIKKTRNLLNTVPIPAGSNFSNQILTNVGNIENKGLEFSIAATPVSSEKLNWDIGFNLTYNENKITNLTAVNNPSFVGNQTGGITGGTGQTVQIHSVNHPVSSFFIYRQVYGKDGRPLEGVYEDLNKDGVINQQDQYWYKSPAPSVMLGFSTQVAWGKWYFSTVLRANLGNYVYNNVNSNFGINSNTLASNAFINGGIPDYYRTGFSAPQYQSDYYISNASFLRMDNVGVTYNVGRLFKSEAGLRVSANCQNVFVYTKYRGLDPELSSGIDYNLYPRARTFVLGLHLDL